MITVKEFIEFGRGIYATQDIEAGTVVETCEIILLSPQDTRNMDNLDILSNHRFAFSRFQDAILLGHGSLFNGHPTEYNTDVEVIFRDYRPMVQFVTNRNISKGEQLFIQYTYNPEDKDEKGIGSLSSDGSISQA